MDKQPQVKIALPKGRLLAETANLIQDSGWGLSGYRDGGRFYRLKSRRFPNISVRVFQEKDIPIQVAVGNYDLGVCGLDWIEELLVRYPSSALVKVKNLGYGKAVLLMAGGRATGLSTIEKARAGQAVVRIASEYPNLAEFLAVKLRLRRFNIFPVWGAAEVYPPETADLVLVAGQDGEELVNCGLETVSRVLDSSAFLIANKSSWETKDLSEVLNSISDKPGAGEVSPSAAEALLDIEVQRLSGRERMSRVLTETRDEGIIWLALPDGHQQAPTLNLLNRAGIQVDDYPSAEGNRRPAIDLAGVMVKVIRPQDMPLQVANGNFDVAITGRDWLREHLYQFPSSPVAELLDLKFGRVKVVAVVIEASTATDVYSLRQLNAERSGPFMVASEYVNIADKYARDNHLGMYRVVPTWGASEAFLPEDADLLIENTQTGQTLAQHNLKIIDTLFESTACLIGNTGSASDAGKGKKIKSIMETLRAAVDDEVN